MNSNTVAGFIGGTARNQIPSLVLASTTETAVPLTTDTGTNSAILAVPSASAIVGSSFPLGVATNQSLSSNFGGQPLNSTLAGNQSPYVSAVQFDGNRPFYVNLSATGTVVANGANTLTVKLYQGTSGTLGSDTAVATPMSAIATASAANVRFFIQFQFFWDSTSAILSGFYSGYYLYNGTATTISSTAITPLTAITTPAALSFVYSIKWGNGVGGTIQVQEFSILQG